MRRLRGSFSRPGNLNADNFGQHALRLIGNVFFGLFVVGVVVFTIIAATYQPEDPLLHPSDKISSFLTSTSNATFRTEESTIRTGEDFIAPANETVAADSFINVADIPLPMNSTEITTESIPAEEDETSTTTTPTVHCDVNEPIDCSDPDIFHLMMRATIEQFKDVHFYRFGKSVQGDSTSSCDMAWRFRPKDAKRAALYKDYRRFLINRGDNCVPTVSSIGDYHSGLNARKKKSKKKKLKSPEEEDIGFEKRKRKKDKPEEVTEVPVVGETVDDALPVVESENSFSSGKYLIYMGGGDRCKDMDHFLWSFLCSLGEAQYLNRTLVMDLNICLSSTYSPSNQDEEGKDFRFYFDFEHLSESASVLDQQQFWSDWNQWQKKDNLGLYLVEDFRVTPMQLTGIKDSLIMRKFGTVEPDNYWYRVCEGETESVVQRPWHFVWKSRRLMEIVSAIATRMNWDFDSVHVVRGKKAKNKELWPNLEADTSPDSLLTTLKDKVDEGRKLYVATNERDTSLFDPLKDKYETHFLDEFKDLWAEGSEWAQEMTQLNNGVPVEFDGYMRMEVDTEVFFRGKKQLETFNDLTRDCKDGVNTCNTAA